MSNQFTNRAQNNATEGNATQNSITKDGIDLTVKEHSSDNDANSHVDSNVDTMDGYWVKCYLGLGSNLANELGSPVEHLQEAIAGLGQHKQIRELRVSSFYASAPMGPQDQPDFINAVAGFETTLMPFALLTFCQQLEQQAKRARLRHWGERSLDIDILLYGAEQIVEPDLTVPHVGLTERNFVLVPLRELAATLMIGGQSIADYEASDDWTGLRRLVD